MASSDAFAQLPALTLKTIDGQEVKINELSNDGKPFIIDLFATWCKPCLRELDAIAEVYDEWKEETGVKLIAVSTDQAQNIQSISRTGYTFDGWSTAPDGDVVYTDGEEVSNLTATNGGFVTLYAQWLPQYTITYTNNCKSWAFK